MATPRVLIAAIALTILVNAVPGTAQDDDTPLRPSAGPYRGVVVDELAVLVREDLARSRKAPQPLDLVVEALPQDDHRGGGQRLTRLVINDDAPVGPSRGTEWAVVLLRGAGPRVQ